MAPKRQTIQGDDASKTKIKRRYSKRFNNIIKDDQPLVASIEPSEKKQLKKKINKKERGVNKKNQINCEEITENNSMEQNTNSMSIDSINNSDCNGSTATSMEESCMSLNDDTQLQPATRRSIHMDDDDNEEFCTMFMSNTPKLNNYHNYNSTPFRVSGKNNKNIHSTADTSLSRSVNNPALGRLSNPINGNYSNRSDSRINNINTPPNFHTIGTLQQSQTCSSIRCSSAVSTTANNITILETFIEYRNLKRDYERASKQNEIWAADYQKLTRRMRRLEQTTFPRPTADGYAFIEQLLHSLRNSQNDEDNRTNAEIARDLGLSEATLMSLSNTDPQKTSLRLFSNLFPTNEEKASLINVAYLSFEHPNLLNNILVFARRCSPGCGYTIAMLREALGNSIRCARHNVKKANAMGIAAVAVAEAQLHHVADHGEDIE